MKNKQEGGFSLIEVVLAMVILALIVVPTCTSLVLSFRVNAKADAMLQAQLAVSSAVEKLMASGIDSDAILEGAENNYGISLDDDQNVNEDFFPDAIISIYEVKVVDNMIETVMPYYKVVVTDNQGLVEVVTHIRKAGA